MGFLLVVSIGGFIWVGWFLLYWPEMNGLNVDSLRVDCLNEKPRDQDWSVGYGEAWEIVQPYDYEDFNESDSPEDWRENEEKTGYAGCDDMLDSNSPMMNYYYPLYHCDSFDMEDAKKISHLPLCIVYFVESEEYALALTGGGMDLSWQICEAYVRLGYYPPTHFRLPKMSGKGASPKNLAIVEACIKGREIARRWANNDIKDLESVRDWLTPIANDSPIDTKGDK